MKIVKDVENKLLSRRTVIATEDTKGASIARLEAKERLAKKLNVDKNLVIIKKISNSFGSSVSVIEAKVYENQEVLNKYARPHLIKRNQEPQKEEAAEE